MTVEPVEAAPERGTPRGGGESLAAVILGNDAIVAARPCTPAQVANACSAAGFDLIIPPSWGDEIVAVTYLEQLAGRTEHVIVGCACPRVAELIARADGVALPQVTLAAPPIAAARALRAVHGDAVLVTYVGDCPSAADPAIDVRFSPVALFSLLGRRGVVLADQSRHLPDDQAEQWRRYASVAGGLPALRFLARPPAERVLRSVDASAFVTGCIPPSRSNILVDVADAAQCVCGGARERIEECEAPRRTTPVVARPAGLTMSATPSAPRACVVRLHGPARLPAHDVVEDAAARGGEAQAGSSSAQPRAVPLSAVPSGIDATHPAVASVGVVEPRTTRRPGRVDRTLSDRVAPLPRPPRRRSLAIVVAPAIVLALAAALGIVVYAGGTSDAGADESVTVRADSGRADVGARGEATTTRPAQGSATGGVAPEGSRAAVRVEPTIPAVGSQSPAARPAAPRIDTAAAISALALVDSLARRDSAARALERRRTRRPAAQVVPGWLPQGRPAFTPIDSAVRRPDSSSKRAPPDTAAPRA